MTGSSNFKHESVKTHDTSQSHRKNFEKNKVPDSHSEANKALKCLNKVGFDKLSILFRTWHSLAKQGRPFKENKDDPLKIVCGKLCLMRWRGSVWELHTKMINKPKFLHIILPIPKGTNGCQFHFCLKWWNQWQFSDWGWNSVYSLRYCRCYQSALCCSEKCWHRQSPKH